MAKRQNIAVKVNWNNKFLPDLFTRVDDVVEDFAERVVTEARANHKWTDRTGTVTADIDWDRVKNVVALKVNNPVGIWLELGFHHSGSGKLIRKPGLTTAFRKMKGELVEKLGGIL